MDAGGSDLKLDLSARVLIRRAAVPVGVAAVVVAGLLIAGGPLRSFADALHRALDADPRWVVGAAAAELASFAGYIALLWLVAGRATSRVDLRASASIALGGAGVTRLLPTAGVGGAALTLWALRRSGLGTAAAARTLLAFLVLLYAVFLAGIAVAGWILALGLSGRHGPLALSAIPAALATAAIAAALALGLRHRPDAESAGRLRGAARLVGGGVRDAIGLLRRPDPRLLGAPVWWAADAGVLAILLHAFGAGAAVPVIALAYLVGQVGNTIPVPGAVSGGMTGILVAFGVAPEVALVAVLAYRAIAIWLPAAIGLAAVPGLRSTVARWGREGANPAASAPGSSTPRRGGSRWTRTDSEPCSSRFQPAAGSATATSRSRSASIQRLPVA